MARHDFRTTFRIPRTATGLCLTICVCFITALVVGLVVVDPHDPAFMPFVGLIELALIGVIARLCFLRKL